MDALNPEPQVLLRYMGCQPILDRNQRLYGHELLYRTGPRNAYSGDGDVATRHVIDGSITMNLEDALGKGKLFINCTRESLVEQLVTLMPPTRTVLEVLETLEVDDVLVNACIQLKELGFQIALDDYTPNPQMDRLLDIADYIKLDFRACNEAELERIRKHVLRPGIELLAEKVETEQEFEQALSLGYRYFQGYFFAKPKMVEEQEVPADALICLQLMHLVNQEPCDLEMIERLLMTDSSLCLRLLRMVNSAGFGVRNGIRTVRQAMLMIGERELAKLILVASAARLVDGGSASRQLLVLALRRARFCELIAPAARQSSGEQYLIGMMSAMEAMLKIPIQKILAKLPLRPEATGVLLGERSIASYPLQLLLAHEAQNWKVVDVLCSRMHLDEKRVVETMTKAHDWSIRQIKSM